MRLPSDYYLPNGLAKNITPRPEGLIEVDRVVDIGAGIRPMQWYRPKEHLCVEPHGAYCEALVMAGGYTVLQQTAQETLPCDGYQAIYLLDVLEHMDRDDGERVVADALKSAGVKQVVVFSPHGWLDQDADAWELGGDYWQTHRSAWTEADFSGWRTWRWQRNFFAVADL